VEPPVEDDDAGIVTMGISSYITKQSAAAASAFASASHKKCGIKNPARGNQLLSSKQGSPSKLLVSSSSSDSGL